MGQLVIVKKEGGVDIVLDDGAYRLENAIVRIKDGEIVGINNGVWKRIKE